MSETHDKPAPEPGAFLDPYKDNNPLVTLESFIDPFKADMLRNRLLAEGIDAVVTGELAANALGSVGTSGNTVRVAVHQSDVDRVQRILAEAPEPTPGAEPIEEPDPNDPEYLAMRSWRSALIGLMLFVPLAVPFSLATYFMYLVGRMTTLKLALCLPLLIVPLYLPVYSLLQAIRSSGNSDRLTSAGTVKVYAAIAIDGLIVILVALIVRLMFNNID